jgi:hypothetical protein
LTKSTIEPSPLTADDLKPLTCEQLEEMFGAHGSCMGKLIDNYVFPVRRSVPASNTDQLWKLVPSAVAKEVFQLHKQSYGGQFERIVASTSLILFAVGLAIFFLRAQVSLS